MQPSEALVQGPVVVLYGTPQFLNVGRKIVLLASNIIRRNILMRGFILLNSDGTRNHQILAFNFPKRAL